MVGVEGFDRAVGTETLIIFCSSASRADEGTVLEGVKALEAVTAAKPSAKRVEAAKAVPKGAAAGGVAAAGTGLVEAVEELCQIILNAI